jgi:putative hydrolase of the HAD superfamily
VIRAVVCDFGGVLTTPLDGSFRAFSDASGISLEAISAALVALEQRDGVNPLHELECGRVTEPAFMADVAAQIAAALGRDVAMHDFTAHYFAGIEPNAPMIELMSALRGEGYRMALLTNNVREWERHWRAMAPVDDIFELVVDSAFVGMRKPDPEIFELTLSRLGVPAEQCLFVDDLERNCDAARDAGMTAVVYRAPEQAIEEIRAALQAAQPPRSSTAADSAEPPQPPAAGAAGGAEPPRPSAAGVAGGAEPPRPSAGGGARAAQLSEPSRSQR